MIQPGQFSQYGALPVPQVTPAMLSLVRTGKVYSLAVVYYEGIPVPGPLLPYTLSPRLRHGDLADIRPGSAAAETITMTVHCGTHIDALCHVGEHQDAQGNPDAGGEPRLYAGQGATVTARDNVGYQGQKHVNYSRINPGACKSPGAACASVAYNPPVDGGGRTDAALNSSSDFYAHNFCVQPVSKFARCLAQPLAPLVECL